MSLDNSWHLNNTMFRILGITDISSYINTTIRTFNSTFYRNTIITIFKWNIWTYHNTCTIIIITFNNTIKICSISITMYSSTILIKTCLTSLDSSWYLNNTISRTCITNISIYTNTINITTYSSIILIKTCVYSLYSSRILINTVCRILITNIIIYINTTIRTSNSTFYRNTILTIFKWNIWTY